MAVLPASFSLSTCAPSYPSTATMATLTSLLLFSCTLIAMAAPIDEELWVHNLHEPPSRRRTDLVYHIGMNSRRKNPAIWTKPGRSYWVLLSVCLPHLLPHPGQGVLTLSFPFILLTPTSYEPAASSTMASPWPTDIRTQVVTWSYTVTYASSVGEPSESVLRDLH